MHFCLDFAGNASNLGQENVPQYCSEKGLAIQACPMSAGGHWADADPPKIRLFKPVYHITMGTIKTQPSTPQIIHEMAISQS